MVLRMASPNQPVYCSAKVPPSLDYLGFMSLVF